MIFFIYLITYLTLGTFYFAFLTTKKKGKDSFKSKMIELSNDKNIDLWVIVIFALILVAVFWPLFYLKAIFKRS